MAGVPQIESTPTVGAAASNTAPAIGLNQAGFQNLFIVSGPGNKNDLIVAINVTRPISIPTQKP